MSVPPAGTVPGETGIEPALGVLVGPNEDDVEAQLAQVDAVRRRVINVVGHALRTPVTTLRGLVDVLDRADPERVREEVVPALVRNTRTVERLLDDLLVVSEVTTVLPVDDPEEVDLAGAVREVWTELSVDDGRGWGADELEIEGTASARLGPRSLQRVLWHLLDNAGKYGDRPVEVTIAEGGTRSSLTIANPGRTPTEEELTLADELFYRSEDAVTRAAGMGIGLPVSRRILAHVGGSIQLAPRDGGGLVVTLDLPAAQGDR